MHVYDVSHNEKVEIARGAWRSESSPGGDRFSSSWEGSVVGNTEANDFLYKLGTGIFHAAVEVELMALNQNQK